MRLYPTGQQQGRSDGCVCRVCRYVGTYVVCRYVCVRERTRGTVCAYRDGVGAGWDPGSRPHRGATQPATGLSLGLRRSEKVEYVGMYVCIHT